MLHSTYPKHIYPHQPGDAPEPWQPRPPSDLGRSPLQAPGRGARGELRPPGDPLMIYLILMMSKTMMIPTSAWPKLAASIRTVHLSLRTQSVSLKIASIVSTKSSQNFLMITLLITIIIIIITTTPTTWLQEYPSSFSTVLDRCQLLGHQALDLPASGKI